MCGDIRIHGTFSTDTCYTQAVGHAAVFEQQLLFFGLKGVDL